MTDLKIGDRIKLNTNLTGTLLYIGEIQASRGTFYGVELDSPNGKSNGTLNGTFYFKCKENHGSFIRLSQFSKIKDEDNIVDKIEDVNTNKFFSKNQVDETVLKEITSNSIELKIPSLEKSTDLIAVNKIPIVSKIIPKGSLPVFNGSNIQRLNNRQSSIMPSITSVSLIRQTKTNVQSIANNSNENDNILAVIKDKADVSEIKVICDKCTAITDDCNEKIETFKILKKKDRDKIILLESANKQLNIRLSEATDLMERFKKDKESISHEYETYKNTMQSMEEAIETITVDKEVAEEELELNRLEVKELKEKVDKLGKENCELTNILSGKGLQLEDSEIIKKYRSAIAGLGEMVETLKTTIESKDNELESLLDKEITLEIEADNLQSENTKLKKDLQDLKEVIDSVSDTEYIIDNLTDKNLQLEAKVATLEERVLQLDEMYDKASQSLDEKKLEIRQLRSENDSLDRNIDSLKQEISCKVNKQSENMDLNSQFRVKIQCLESEILTLKVELKHEKFLHRDTVTPLPRVSQVARTSSLFTSPKLIDSQLKELELRQNIQLSNILKRFLVDSFDKSECYIDIIEIVLLVDRFLAKISMILTHMSEKKHTFSNDCEVKVFHTNLEFLLLYWQDVLSQLKKNINQSDINDLGDINNTYPAMKCHEKRIDIILSWIQKDNFDESRDLRNLVESVAYFRCVFKDWFSSPLFDSELKIKYFIKIVKIGSQCLDHNILLIESAITSKVDINLRFKDLTQFMKKFADEIQSKVKSMFTHMINVPKLQLPLQYVTTIDEAVLSMNHLVQSLSQFSGEITTDKVSLDNFTSRLLEIFHIHFNCSTVNSAKEIIELITKIKDTVNSVSDCLDDGRLEVIGKERISYSKVTETIVDKCVQRNREILSKLRRLKLDVGLKDRQIMEFNVELTKKTEHLQESLLSINHIKSKFKKSMNEKDEHVKEVNDRLLKMTMESKSKEETILSLGVKITSLIKQINDLENAPVNIEEVELHAVNNKEGYITEIRILKSALVTLTKKLDKVRSKNAQTMIKDLRPLNVPSRKYVNNNDDACIAKAQNLAYDIYKTMSTVSVVSLLSENVPKCIKERQIAVDILKFKSGLLKHKCSRKIMGFHV